MNPVEFSYLLPREGEFFSYVCLSLCSHGSPHCTGPHPTPHTLSWPPPSVQGTAPPPNMFKLAKLGHHCTGPPTFLHLYIIKHVRSESRQLASYWNSFLAVMLLLFKYSTITMVCLVSKVLEQGCARFPQFV